MLGSYGLSTYIWNNRLKSLVLLAGFPVLLLLICFAFALLIAATNDPSVGQGIADATAITPRLVPVAVLGSLMWFVIAWFANTGIVAAATGAHSIQRARIDHERQDLGRFYPNAHYTSLNAVRALGCQSPVQPGR